MKKQVFAILISLGFVILTVLNLICVWISPFYLWIQISLTVLTTLLMVALFYTYFVNKKHFNVVFSIAILEAILIVLFMFLYYSGLIENLSSIESARSWIESFGAWGWVVFFLIQVAQVIILPIPSQITTLAGIALLGPWITFVISSIAVILGSLACFAIGKFVGVNFVYKIGKKETVDKYRKLISDKGRILLPVMFLFPFFPDDLICFVAGTTAMSWKYFVPVTFITRVIGVGFMCAFGSGEIIPFSGWGIPVWIVVITLLAVMCVFLFKYQAQIESKIIEFFTRDRKKKVQIAKTDKTDKKRNNDEQKK